MFEMKAQLRVFEAQETHANYQNTNKQRDLSNKFLNLPLRLITFFSKKTALQGSVHCWTTKWHHKMAQLTWQNPFGELLLLCAAGFISRSGRTRVTWQPWWPGWCVDGFFGGKVLEKIRRSEIFKSESGKILVNSSAFFFWNLEHCGGFVFGKLQSWLDFKKVLPFWEPIQMLPNDAKLGMDVMCSILVIVLERHACTWTP